MKKYTVETLKDINESYDSKYRVTPSDVEKVNQLIEVIESSRNNAIPQVGDIVQFTSKYGDYYDLAHIQGGPLWKLNHHKEPSAPFVNVRDNKVNTDTSGGAWTNIPSDIHLVGTKEKAFVAWGHGGARANGAIRFFAKVNVWVYVEGEHEFTTKTHDKFHVNIVEQQSPNDYKYIVTKNAISHSAFKTDEEYLAWLKTYHGVEMEGYMLNSKIVWTYKKQGSCPAGRRHSILPVAVVDSELNNASVQDCKRIFEGTKVKTFMPYQKDKIVLPCQKRYMNAY